MSCRLYVVLNTQVSCRTTRFTDVVLVAVSVAVGSVGTSARVRVDGSLPRSKQLVALPSPSGWPARSSALVLGPQGGVSWDNATLRGLPDVAPDCEGSMASSLITKRGPNPPPSPAHHPSAAFVMHLP